jgi:hypothetical protein
MKHTRAIFSLAAATAIVIASGFASGTTLRTVRDPENRFTIAIPSTWSVQTSTASRAPAVAAKAPTAAGHLPDSLDVITQDLSVPITPAACLSEATTVMRFSIHSWTTLHEGTTTLAGIKGYSRSYVWRSANGAQRRSVQTCITLGRRAFVLVGTTENTPAAAGHDLAQIEQIMQTFRPVVSTLPPAAPPPPDRTPGNR